MNILIAILDRNASPVSFLLRDVSSLLPCPPLRTLKAIKFKELSVLILGER